MCNLINVINISLVLLIVIGCSISKTTEINFEPILLEMINCEVESNCTDSVYVASQPKAISFFESDHFYGCLKEKVNIEIGQLSVAASVKANLSNALKENEEIDFSHFTLDDNWIPPKNASKAKSYLCYSDLLMHQDKYVGFIGIIYSGTNIRFSIIEFEKMNMNFEAKRILCSYNPY